MRIRTLLNKFEYLKSFVYKNEFLEKKNAKEVLIIEIVPRKNSRAVCSGCGESGSTYDHTPVARDFEFVPLWGMSSFFRYRMRRVNCRQCGVRIEQIPWAQGKQTLTKTYGQFLAHWAKTLSWAEVARAFNSSWYHVYEGVKQVVEYGLKHRDLSDIEAIGIDEIHYGKGHNYLTMVYQLDGANKRLLSIAKKRTVKSLLKCFREIGQDNLPAIK